MSAKQAPRADSATIAATEAPREISLEEGAADRAIRLTLASLHEPMTGNPSPTVADAIGRLKIEGSTGFAMKVSVLLDEDR